jgi:hypothetical protein
MIHLPSVLSRFVIQRKPGLPWTPLEYSMPVIDARYFLSRQMLVRRYVIHGHSALGYSFHRSSTILPCNSWQSVCDVLTFSSLWYLRRRSSPLPTFIQFHTLLLNLIYTERAIPASSTLQERSHVVDIAQGLQNAVLGILHVVFRLGEQVKDSVVAD